MSAASFVCSGMASRVTGCQDFRARPFSENIFSLLAAGIRILRRLERRSSLARLGVLFLSPSGTIGLGGHYIIGSGGCSQR